MTDKAASHTGHAWVIARRRLAELVIVFVGVYSAFLLNRFDTDRRDAKRRVQLLDAFEQEVAASAEELQRDIAQASEGFAEFDRQLAAGGMPPIGISFIDSGYSPLDDAALLQAGGFELLDMQTVQLVREVNDLERSLLAFTHDQFEFRLTEIPNHDPADFYDEVSRYDASTHQDVVTHRLKKRYEWYPRLQHATLASARTLLDAEEKLLAHLRAAQHPGAPVVSPAPSPASQTTPPSSPAASSPPA